MRVVLDTCVVRNLAHLVGSKMDVGLAESNRHDFQFMVAHAAVGEILEQILEGKLRVEEWQTAALALERFLSPCLPVFPRLREIPGIRQFVGENLVESSLVVEPSRDLWRLLIEIDDPDWPNQADKTSFDELINPTRGEYGNLFSHLGDTGEFQDASQAEMISSVQDFLERTYGNGNLLKMMEIPSMALGRFLYLRMQTPAYNPFSIDRRTDPYDFEMLHVTVVPETLFCTSDKRLLTHLELSGVEIPGRVLSVEDLNAKLA